MSIVEDRKSYIQARLDEWSRWQREASGNPYPDRSTIYNVMKYGPDGAGSGGWNDDGNPRAELVDRAVAQLKLCGMEQQWRCVVAKYGRRVRGATYYDLPDFKIQQYLNISKRDYYRALDSAYNFIDGFLSGKE